MIDFFFKLPNSRALLLTFRTNCPDWSHFAQLGSHFAQNTTTNLCSLLSRHEPLSGIYVHKTPPNPPQNSDAPFPGLNLKVGKMNYRLGKMDPNWAKCLKSGQNVSRSGQKKFIHWFNGPSATRRPAHPDSSNHLRRQMACYWQRREGPEGIFIASVLNIGEMLLTSARMSTCNAHTNVAKESVASESECPSSRLASCRVG